VHESNLFGTGEEKAVAQALRNTKVLMLNSWSIVLGIVLGAAAVYSFIAVVLLRRDSWRARIAMFVVVVVWSFVVFFLGFHGIIQRSTVFGMSTVLGIVLGAAVVYPLIAVVVRSDSWWARIAMFVVMVVWSFVMFFFGATRGSIQVGVSRGHMPRPPSASGSSQ
jgi:hypothetical protein